ncbi:hypothetical protein ACOME3_003870 [Neoechinorhynchus agilis]
MRSLNLRRFSTLTTHIHRSRATTAFDHGYTILMPDIPALRPNEKNHFMDFIINSREALGDFPNLKTMSSYQMHNALCSISRQFELFVNELNNTLCSKPEATFDQVFGSIDRWASIIQNARETAKMFARVRGGRHFLVYLNTINHFGMEVQNPMLLYSLARASKTSNDEEKRLADLYAIQFFRKGYGLKETIDRFQSHIYQLEKEQATFLTKLAKCTSAYSLFTGDRLESLPPHLRDRLKHVPEVELGVAAPNTLTFNDSLLPVLEYCSDRKIRKEYYSEYRGRASLLQGHLELNNRIHASARQDISSRLGYDSYAELSLEPTLISPVSKIVDLMEEARSCFRPINVKEFEAINKFATEADNLKGTVQPYDFRFYRRLQANSVYGSVDRLRDKFDPVEVIK